MKTGFRLFLIVMALIIFSTFLINISVFTKTKHPIQITVNTGYNHQDCYFVTEYKEDNGCISFKDAFGTERKICGSYQIKKW